jgi:hypothetical protein
MIGPDGELELKLSEVIARLWESDPHAFSTRTCQTCRTVGALLGRSFGCSAKAEKADAEKAKAKAEISVRPTDATGIFEESDSDLCPYCRHPEGSASCRATHTPLSRYLKQGI